MAARIRVRVGNTNGLVDESWKERGNCRTVPVEQFFEFFEIGTIPERKETLNICNNCPVKQRCNDYAKLTKSTGVFGGNYYLLGKRVKNPLTSYLINSE